LLINKFVFLGIEKKVEEITNWGAYREDPFVLKISKSVRYLIYSNSREIKEEEAIGNVGMENLHNVMKVGHIWFMFHMIHKSPTLGIETVFVKSENRVVGTWNTIWKVLSMEQVPT